MMNISIIGHHITKFGELWDRSLQDLLTEALQNSVNQAFERTGLKPGDIDAIFVSNKASGSFNHQRHVSALASEHFDHFPPAIRVEAACASGGVAIMSACQALRSGQYKTVLVVGVEKMTDASAAETTQILASAANMELEYGSTFPGLYALLAQAHMTAFGTSRENLSAVAVKNHRHAVSNPTAQFRREMTLEQVSNSALVADPLRILDCSPISDGAAAVVLTSQDVSDRQSTTATIIGQGQGQDSLDLASRASFTELAATVRAAKEAYTQAGVAAKDIQMAEVHDCFTIAEILASEDLGFVPKGAGGEAVIAGKTTYGGAVVINPSGGLKACGHPVGATGVKQLAYLASMIEKGACELGLTHNVGGSGATAVVNILAKKGKKGLSR